MSTQRSSPPVASLRAFAAAGRLQSLRDAAAELGVTPSAISHQVKALETWVGRPLFERSVRHVRLTAEGAALSAALNAGFRTIDEGLDRARQDTGPQKLTVASLPLFVTAWLGPRIHQFEAQHPALSLSIHTDPRVYDLLAGEADVAVRNVGAPSPGLYARKLLDLRAVPLCSRAVAERVRRPEDLAQATLIGLSVGRMGWPDWLKRVGVAGLEPQRTITVDSLPEAIAAAVQGRGVMLGLSPLVWDLPSASDLVVPFKVSAFEAGAYFLVCRKQDRVRPVVAAFLEWVVAEMRADTRRLMRAERRRLLGDDGV